MLSFAENEWSARYVGDEIGLIYDCFIAEITAVLEPVRLQGSDI